MNQEMIDFMQKIFIFTGLVALFLMTGCGGDKLKTYPVTGTVTYKGEIVAGATVSFNPKVPGEGDDAYARTDNNGVYKLQTQLGKPEGGTTPGEYIVRVVKMEAVPTGRRTVDSTGEVTEETDAVSAIPQKYGSSLTTPLSFTVEKKKNVYDIEIVD